MGRKVLVGRHNGERGTGGETKCGGEVPAGRGVLVRQHSVE